MTTYDNTIENDPKKLDLPHYIDQASFVKNKKGCYLLQISGWVFWSLLFVPIFTLLLWLYQGNLIKNYIFAEKFDVQMLNIVWLAGFVVFFGSTLILWAGFNWIRFRHQHTPQLVLNVNNQVLATYLKLSPQELETMQCSKRVVLYYDDHGLLYDYQIKRFYRQAT